MSNMGFVPRLIIVSSIVIVLVLLGVYIGTNGLFISESEKQQQIVMSRSIYYSKEYVSQFIDSPSTAVFPSSPDEYKFQYYDDSRNDIIQVTGYVDAENIFGSTVRHDYFLILEFSEDFERADLGYLEMDGNILHTAR